MGTRSRCTHVPCTEMRYITYFTLIPDETASYESIITKARFTCFAKDRGMYTPDNLHDSVLKLHKYCLTHLLDSYRVHLNRLKGKLVFTDMLLSSVCKYW